MIKASELSSRIFACLCLFLSLRGYCDTNAAPMDDLVKALLESRNDVEKATFLESIPPDQIPALVQALIARSQQLRIHSDYPSALDVLKRDSLQFDIIQELTISSFKARSPQGCGSKGYEERKIQPSLLLGTVRFDRGQHLIC